MFKLFLLINLFICLVNSSEPPKLIVISLDGFRGDYLDSELTPFMYNLSREGVWTKRMKSLYATKTFPNHFSISTGLFEENHGIINNKMYDPKFKDFFIQSNNEERWWNDKNVETIWNLNQGFSGRYSASSMWPGGSVSYNGKKNKYSIRYRTGLSKKDRMEQIIDWLTLPNEPANFVMVYIDQPDNQAHKTGPYSPEVKKQIQDLDESIKYLYGRLESLDLTNKTNLIVLSDHGMSEIREERILQIGDLFDSSKVIISGSSPNINLHLKKQYDLNKIYRQLKQVSKELPFKVYIKGKSSELDNFHFSKHRRIGDIVLEADDEYEIKITKSSSDYDYFKAEKIIKNKKMELKNLDKKLNANDQMSIMKRFDDFLERKKKTTSKFTGKHGYDNNLPNMRPLFFAIGPAFKEKYEHKTGFYNLDLYPLMCNVLKIDDKAGSSPKYCKNDAEPYNVLNMLKNI